MFSILSNTMGSGNKILMFEDDAYTAEFNQLFLENNNFSVHNVNNVDNVLEEVLSFQPDIILMDLRIPSIGGDKATEMIKTDERTRNIPVVLYSADIRIDVIAGKVNADAYIKKPFDIDEFVNLIEKQL